MRQNCLHYVKRDYLGNSKTVLKIIKGKYKSMSVHEYKKLKTWQPPHINTDTCFNTNHSSFNLWNWTDKEFYTKNTYLWQLQHQKWKKLSKLMESHGQIKKGSFGCTELVNWWTVVLHWKTGGGEQLKLHIEFPQQWIMEPKNLKCKKTCCRTFTGFYFLHPWILDQNKWILSTLMELKSIILSRIS